MTTLTATRNYPVDRKEAFAYLTDPMHWPDFYSGIVAIDGDGADWDREGATVGFTYSLFGRRLHGEATLDEIQPGEAVMHTAAVPGLPDVRQRWEYRDTGDGFAVDVTVGTGETTSFFGKAVDRLVVAKALEQDVMRTLDRLEEVFALGVPPA